MHKHTYFEKCWKLNFTWLGSYLHDENFEFIGHLLATAKDCPITSLFHGLKQRWNGYVFLFIQIRLGIGNGYPCFVISIAMIGICTAVIGDVAGHLGCFIFLKDSVNAIAFVALGTSVPGIL